MRAAQLVDGTALNGPATLRQALLAKSDVVRRRVAERLLTYAVGRAHAAAGHAGGARDHCARRPATTIGSRRSSSAIVKSAPFQMKTKAQD